MNARMYALNDVRVALDGLVFAEKAALKAAQRYARAKPGAAKGKMSEQVRATEAERQLCFLRLRRVIIEAGLAPNPAEQVAA